MDYRITWYRVDAIPALALLSAGISSCTGHSPAATSGSITQQARAGSPSIAAPDHDLGPGKLQSYADGEYHTLVCQTSNCGGNSPIVNRFPINGLHPDAYANSQGIRLLPGKIVSDNPNCNNATLNVSSTNVLGVKGGGPCVHDKLVGATFEVSLPAGNHTIKRSIRISAAGTLPHDGGGLAAYKFTWRRSGVSLCNREEAQAFYEKTDVFNDLDFRERELPRKDVGLTNVTVDELTPPGATIPQADAAIVFLGEVRGEDGSTIGGSTNAGWFNIACVRDALARADIYGIQPHQPNPMGDYDARRQAALKMLTANYCDHGRYTYEDNEIQWERKAPNGSWEFPGQHGAKPTGNFEAVWDAKGVRCIENTRLYNKQGIVVVVPPDSFPPGCPDNVCKNSDEFLRALKTVCTGLQRGCAAEMNNGYFRSYSTGD